MIWLWRTRIWWCFIRWGGWEGAAKLGYFKGMMDGYEGCSLKSVIIVCRVQWVEVTRTSPFFSATSASKTSRSRGCAHPAANWPVSTVFAPGSKRANQNVHTADSHNCLVASQTASALWTTSSTCWARLIATIASRRNVESTESKWVTSVRVARKRFVQTAGCSGR